ncbi:oligoendopeptidase F [Haploplasma axanthum]|uniref:Oligopeptidase F n=1 Tax=Haploplasma axanthum TaxID=29552 RepID=A0A449BDL3_HAPAX|nr:oligoendopeptidase F [Haploplasma axanthum]VEU80536.1 Oligoendopeptidase F, plasmid [Haploplasma axanthum]
MDKKVLKRHEVEEKYTWDLKRLFKTEKDYDNAVNEVMDLVDKFQENYKGKIKSVALINNALNDYRHLTTKLNYVGTYQNLHLSVDQTNEENVMRSGNIGIKYAEIGSKLTFFSSELKALNDELLNEAAKVSADNNLYIKEIMKDKKHSLSAEVEQALSEFSQVLGSTYPMYDKVKFSDMKFDSFEIDGKEYPMSFTLFENEWSYDSNHKVRRAAFKAFYEKLGEYENGLAHNYQTHVLKEKAYATLKGFDSVIDYLLYNQDVSRDMYDRQIDLIMEYLSKPMQKFAKHIKDIYGLDKLTYADLHLAIDDEFEPKVTIEESREYSINALSIYGSEYTEMVRKSFDERWIDFPQNLGKSTGGFCSSPYQKGSFILLNWNSQMSEVFVLAHELGHAGHFYYGGKNQNAFNTRPSLYFIEAPSTMNELIMADYLKKQNNDLRFNRWVLSTIISRTYYHNFVTHLLEAAYQREVYKRVDDKKPLSAKVLNELKLNVLKKFWGDTVEIDDYAGRTWMRQPHYFMGLYPYTYSAGLTVATATFEKIKNNELDINRWLDVLSAGGTKNPLELAKMVDVDLSTEKPLLETIKSISNIINEIVELTDKINESK